MPESPYITLPLYTNIAKDIVNAAIFNWHQLHRRTQLAHLTIADFSEKIAPDGSLVVFNCNYYHFTETTINAKTIAKAVKELITSATIFQANDLGKSPVINDGMEIRRTPEVQAILLDKLKNMPVITNAFSPFRYEWKEDSADRGAIAPVKINSQDAWIVYGSLLDHQKSTLSRQFKISRIDEVIGIPANPMTIEQSKTMFNMIDEISCDASEKIHKMETEMHKKLDEIREKYNEKIAEINNLAKAKIRKIRLDFEKLKNRFN